MKASPDKVVKISYQLRTEPEGQIVDSAEKESPFAFLFGHNNVLEQFEKNLEGLTPGNQFSFILTAEDGYGEYDDEAIITLEKSAFSHEGNIMEDMLFEGNIIPLQDQHGNPFQGRIASIEGDKVSVDMNHPFAGKTLYFSGEVVEVRDANQTELEHGHVHEHGHHHH